MQKPPPKVTRTGVVRCAPGGTRTPNLLKMNGSMRVEKSATPSTADRLTVALRTATFERSVTA